MGRPQIKLNFEQQRLEAEFRHHMVRVREYSESIALDRGEGVERQQLGRRFGLVLDNFLALLNAQKRLVWFTSFFGQAAVVFPFVVAAPRFFSGAIALGELMQISSAFGQVQGSLSWFVDNYSSLAAWRATTDRLTSFEASFKEIAPVDKASDAINSAGNQKPAAAPALVVEALDLSLPDGTTLLANASVALPLGRTVLLQGPSGSGKSTLFRAIAGIWPYAQGHIQRPADMQFVPQRPYFAQGRLRDALAYPQDASTYSDAQLQDALRQALLPELTPRLDELAAWGHTLSGGEQQRLALARVLLKKPRWVFADEATSALDEAAERQLYQALVAAVKAVGGTLVSIAHKPGVAAFHDQRWTLEAQPGSTARSRWMQTGG
jgi:putative ATP-binding cassette transporter